MTVTIHLPQSVEQAYVSAAQTRGVSVDVLLTDVLVSHVPATGPEQRPELIEEQGIPVLRTGPPLDPSIVSDTLDAIRRERDFSVLGQGLGEHVLRHFGSCAGVPGGTSPSQGLPRTIRTLQAGNR